MRHITLALLAVMGLVSCATPLKLAGKGVRDATISMVSHCEYIGNFTATDMGGGDLEQRLLNVKTKIKNQAGEAGANYVVWGSPIRGGSFGNEPILTGDAYNCK